MVYQSAKAETLSNINGLVFVFVLCLHHVREKEIEEIFPAKFFRSAKGSPGHSSIPRPWGGRARLSLLGRP
jgi:hypothetical protein